MGVVLDSSVLIASERGARPISELLASLAEQFGETEFLLSAITVMEMEHGWHRATTPESANKRRRYIDEVLAVIPVESFSQKMGVLAAGIDATLRRNGTVIPTADLLIGVTAVHFGYAIATRNVRHFQMIPGLSVIVV